MDQTPNTPHRWIAFLRAINVGGHTVKMDALRGLFESLGYAKVETFIASGNVIFETPAGNSATLEQQIEAELQSALGYPVATFLRSPTDLAAIAQMVEQNGLFPIEALTVEGTSLYVAFLKAPVAEEAQQKLLALRTEFDDFFFVGRELYWLSHRPISQSKVTGAQMERVMKAQTTMRNFNTVQRLAAKGEKE